MQITSHTIEYLGKCSDEACVAYGTLTCTRGTLSKEMRKKKIRVLIWPEVYEAFYDFVVGIHVNSETEFEQDRGHLFGP